MLGAIWEDVWIQDCTRSTLMDYYNKHLRNAHRTTDTYIRFGFLKRLFLTCLEKICFTASSSRRYVGDPPIKFLLHQYLSLASILFDWGLWDILVFPSYSVSIFGPSFFALQWDIYIQNLAQVPSFMVAECMENGMYIVHIFLLLSHITPCKILRKVTYTWAYEKP